MVLALTTALITVLGAFLPSIVDLVSKKDSDLLVQYLGDDKSGGLLFLITNSGNRPGGVRSAYYGYETNSENRIYEGHIDLKNSDLVVAPAEVATLRVTFSDVEIAGERLPPVHFMEIVGSCFIKVRVVSFSGAKSDQLFEDDCTSMRSVVKLRR